MSVTDLAHDTFLDRMMASVRQFVQTIVVLDDEADYGPSPINATLDVSVVEPPTGDIHTVDETTATPSTESTNRKEGSLDAEKLIDHAAKCGIVCAVLKAKAENEKDPVLLAAKNADILILDWEMCNSAEKNDSGVRAKNVIRDLFDEDERVGGRLRFICIYTQEIDLKDCSKHVLERLGESSDQFTGYMDARKEDFRLKELTVVFVRKKEYSEDRLIEELLKRYEKTVHGLLPRVVLESVAAVREKTHALLSRYSSELDGAYLAHRALLNGSADAEQFIADLVADDMRGILEAYNVGANTVDFATVESFVEQSPLPFRLRRFHEKDSPCPTCKKHEEQQQSCDHVLFDVCFLNILDPEQPKEGVPESSDQDRKQGFNPCKNVYPVNYPSCQKAESYLRQFSSYSSLKRGLDHQSLTPEDWGPIINTGTILQHQSNKEFLLCVQPSCDCLRIKKDKADFLFLTLSTKRQESDRPCIALRGMDGQYVLMSFAPTPHHLRIINFRNSICSIRKLIISQKNGESFEFTASDGQKYHWIGDMREGQIRRIIQRLFENLSRIGLDEFEWLRMMSR